VAVPENGFSRALEAVYPELRAIAAAYLRRERHFHTLGPTALVHESLLKLNPRSWPVGLPSAEFMKRIARAMRLVLVDHARRRKSLKRGRGVPATELDASLLAYERSVSDLLALDEAMDRLETMDRELALIVELRFFGGLSEEQVAEELQISLSSVARGWRFSRLWLARELTGRG
jgi:RNA polymerase sigma-70 factor (ECF subfamily)